MEFGGASHHRIESPTSDFVLNLGVWGDKTRRHPSIEANASRVTKTAADYQPATGSDMQTQKHKKIHTHTATTQTCHFTLPVSHAIHAIQNVHTQINADAYTSFTYCLNTQTFTQTPTPTHPHTHTHTHTHIYTHTHDYTHTRPHTRKHRRTDAHTHTNTRIHMHTRAHTNTHTYKHKRTHMHTHNDTHIYTRTYTHTLTHTPSHTHTHTNTRTNTSCCKEYSWPSAYSTQLTPKEILV